MHFGGKKNFVCFGAKHGFFYPIFTFKVSLSVSVVLTGAEQGKFKVVPPHSSARACMIEWYKHCSWEIAAVCSTNSEKKCGTFF